MLPGLDFNLRPHARVAGPQIRELAKKMQLRHIGEAKCWSRDNYREMFARAGNPFTDSSHRCPWRHAGGPTCRLFGIAPPGPRSQFVMKRHPMSPVDVKPTASLARHPSQPRQTRRSVH